MSGVFQETAAKLPKPKYEYIIDRDEALEKLDYLNQFDVIEFDTEGTSLSPFDGETTLMQFGVNGRAFIFDVRDETKHSNINASIFEPILKDKSKVKLLQNAVYDMKMLKYHYGYYVENVYDTMLVEQLLNLGMYTKATLGALVYKYLGLHMDKEPRDTFLDKNQVYKPYQLEYAATDVCVLTSIREAQVEEIINNDLQEVCRLEFEFTKPMSEMELNGILVDKDKWRIIMAEVAEEKEVLKKIITGALDHTVEQQTLFNVSLINIDSPLQLKQALIKYGLAVEGTAEEELKKFSGVAVVDNILKYRKAEKLISTYSETLLEKIHEITGRLHTSFKQLVRTGRMSSSNPNLQNIPGEQKYRTCFVAKEGCVLITADMQGAELRILGNVSKDKVFIESYASGIDLHTKGASGVFNIPYDKVTKEQRTASKAISFGLVYGLSKFGLSRRLKIPEKKAERLIANYFKMYTSVKKWLDRAAASAVANKYSVSISGRKRFYDIPAFDTPDKKKIINSVRRKGMNHPIQGANADTIKQAMIYCVERLEKLDYYAKLLLTVHDEIIIECIEEKAEEVAAIVCSSIIDGFGKYFSLIPMETEALISPCWMKGECEKDPAGNKCGSTEFEFIADVKYGTKLVCKNCNKEQ